jgi:predicted RNase H-like HicB family nuclease
MVSPITIVLEPAEDGWFTSTILEMPEAISQGASRQEAIENVLEAVKDLFEYRRKRTERTTGKEFIVSELQIA